MVAPFLNTATFAGLQAMDEANMPATCSIVHPATPGINPDHSPDDSGTPTTVTGIRCRFQNANAGAREILLAMRLTEEADAVLTVPLATTVGLKDTIIFGGGTWLIIGTNAGQAYATSLSLALRLQQ